ncbi:DUF5067 domain-containing protein [Vagococcus sp.]|uniref:DUF5067 domain-containing protein n=1 Tax=Vagococcus sp. TaxID=1933889 RepID=UPI003F9C6AA9
MSKNGYSYSPQKKQFKGPGFEVTFLKSEGHEDIYEREGLFVHSEIKNTSKKAITPESIYNQHILFMALTNDLEEPLYPTVLTKKDLNDSTFKKEIDRMSKEVKPNETVKVGQFFTVPNDKIKIQLLDDHFEKLYEGKWEVK